MDMLVSIKSQDASSLHIAVWLLYIMYGHSLEISAAINYNDQQQKLRLKSVVLFIKNLKIVAGSTTSVIIHK